MEDFDQCDVCSDPETLIGRNGKCKITGSYCKEEVETIASYLANQLGHSYPTETDYTTATKCLKQEYSSNTASRKSMQVRLVSSRFIVSTRKNSNSKTELCRKMTDMQLIAVAKKLISKNLGNSSYKNNTEKILNQKLSKLDRHQRIILEAYCRGVSNKELLK